MEWWTWITYVGVITALIIFPGPVALLCTTHGLRFGRHRAFATVLGGGLASMVLMVLSALGLGAVLATSETAFFVLKLLGGAYLIFLGLQAWLTVPHSPVTEATEPEPASVQSVIGLFRQGFLVGIGNPKDLLFFAALFPNFITIGEPQVLQFAILALTWLVIDTTLMTLYTTLGAGVGHWFDSPRRLRAFHRTTGGLFLGAGGTLIATSASN
ncbi:LysE family translocator [Billgrantia endophytica]|uniref:Amino acid transporter n=1 Tax=Billgrantia endophytica TaxID=2033802 RepID=A0A2N7TW34_9GAMM|nr:LysE family translocator [Halomonas endophytica]PMR72402.1 amino acid transporter [Halomonas endophytica]